LSQLRFTFTLHGSLSPSVEQVIPEVNTKGAEIARQEWDIILVAVPGESLHKWRLGGPEGAAARLGLKPTTLFHKMKRLGITRPADH